MDTSSDAIEAEAAGWLARRDRGFTAQELGAFTAWRDSDARHAQAAARLEAAWNALDGLQFTGPAARVRPDPDLFKPASARPFLRRAVLPFAAAAAVALLLGLSLRHAHAPAPNPAAPPAPSLAEARQVTLPDGFVVCLNRGASIQVGFTPAERRVLLVRGEANFTVTKDAKRPFLVSAGPVVVRAVGTVFNVRIQRELVSVLVTEGKVRVAGKSSQSADASTPALAPLLAAGQRALISTVPAGPAPVVETLSSDQIETLLGWQGARLVFSEKSLSEIAAEFNLRNRRQLVMADSATGAIRVGGNFRADNVDAFVRLLEASFGVAAEQRADGAVILRKVR